MKSFTGLLRHYSETNTNGFAIICKDKIYTWAVLNSFVSITAETLLNNGVIQGSRVVILSENNPDFIILILALWEIGAEPIPLNTKLTQTELTNIFEFCSPDFILIHRELNKLFFEDKRVRYFPFEYNTSGSGIEPAASSLQNTALVIFTSGSTGKPKGAVHTFESLINSCLISSNTLDLQQSDKFLLSLPVYHIGGFSIIVRALYAGAAVIIPASGSVADLIYSIEKLRPTHISLVPTQLMRILENDIKPNPELRHLLIGGGPTDDDLILEAYNKGWKVNKVYGSTETAAFVTALDIPDFPNKYQSVGKPLPGVLIKIEKEKPENSFGEILISSPSLISRYLFNETETAERFCNGYYLTGDLGYQDDEGFLYIESRRTDLIISGGENINPVEVEEQIKKFPAVKEVCVFGKPDNKWGQICSALIVTNSNAVITIDDIKKFLSDKLASYKIPKHIFFTEELPRTGLGKIKRNEIINKFSGQ